MGLLSAIRSRAVSWGVRRREDRGSHWRLRKAAATGEGWRLVLEAMMNTYSTIILHTTNADRESKKLAVESKLTNCLQKR